MIQMFCKFALGNNVLIEAKRQELPIIPFNVYWFAYSYIQMIFQRIFHLIEKIYIY